jgi:hypothetical protein
MKSSIAVQSTRQRNGTFASNDECPFFFPGAYLSGEQKDIVGIVVMLSGRLGDASCRLTDARKAWHPATDAQGLASTAVYFPVAARRLRRAL